MNTRILSLTLVLALLAASSGCALQARSDGDPHATLARCHSYAFGKAVDERRESAFANPLNDQRLRTAITAQLQARGLQAAAQRESADCLVRYAIGSRLEFEPPVPRLSWGLGFGWGHRGYGALGADTGYAYRDGRVSVDLVDARSRDALWHGHVDDDVTLLTGDAAEQRIRADVAAIFARLATPAATRP